MISNVFEKIPFIFVRKFVTIWSQIGDLKEWLYE